MPPKSSEQNYTQEVENTVEKQYLDIERGDITQNQPSQDYSSQVAPASQPPMNSQAQAPADPVTLVKNMISLGFTPSQTQISQANDNLDGSVDSSDTWFAFFLQKLLKQQKGKRK